MSGYAEVDRLILMRVKQLESASYASLCETIPLMQKATAVAIPDRWGSRDGSRVIDRRLQALRKSGAIKLEKRRWVIA